MAITIHRKSETLAGLDSLIATTRQRLAANPDYIALRALERARAEIVGVKAQVVAQAIDDVIAEIESEPHQPKLQRISQLAGAEKALENAGEPLTIRTLMEGAVAAGAVIGGNNPQVNFGSSLSKSDRFKTVRWKGEEHAWWFADRPLPNKHPRPTLLEKEAAE